MGRIDTNIERETEGKRQVEIGIDRLIDEEQLHRWTVG